VTADNDHHDESFALIASNTGHRLLSTQNRKAWPTYVPQLQQAICGNIMGLQLISSKLFMLHMKTKNPKHITYNLIFWPTALHTYIQS
jgi:hypothetical protein